MSKLVKYNFLYPIPEEFFSFVVLSPVLDTRRSGVEAAAIITMPRYMY